MNFLIILSCQKHHQMICASNITLVGMSRAYKVPPDFRLFKDERHTSHIQVSTVWEGSCQVTENRG